MQRVIVSRLETRWECLVCTGVYFGGSTSMLKHTQLRLCFGARKANIPMPSFKSYGRALVPIALVLRPLAACKKASKEWYAGLISAA